MAAHFVDLQSLILELIDNVDVPLHEWGTWEPTGKTSKVAEVIPSFPFAVIIMEDGTTFDLKVMKRH